MGHQDAAAPHNRAFNVTDDKQSQGGSKCFDDDGRLRRTGNNCIKNLLHRYVLGLSFQVLNKKEHEGGFNVVLNGKKKKFVWLQGPYGPLART